MSEDGEYHGVPGKKKKQTLFMCKNDDKPVTIGTSR